VAASCLIMRLLVRPMAMRLLHGCEEAAPLLDRVIGSLHPRQTQNNGDLNEIRSIDVGAYRHTAN